MIPFFTFFRSILRYFCLFLQNFTSIFPNFIIRQFAGAPQFWWSKIGVQFAVRRRSSPNALPNMCACQAQRIWVGRGAPRAAWAKPPHSAISTSDNTLQTRPKFYFGPRFFWKIKIKKWREAGARDLGIKLINVLIICEVIRGCVMSAWRTVRMKRVGSLSKDSMRSMADANT